MGFVGNCSQAVGKFHGIWIPIAHAAKPTRIYVKHLQTKLFRFSDHLQRQRFVHLHSTAPAVVHHQWILRIFPRERVAEDSAHPATELISGSIRPTFKRTQKHCRRLKRLVWLQTRFERPRLRIEAEYRTQPVPETLKRNARPATELDARIPAALCAIRCVDHLRRNNLALFSRLGVRIR